MRWPIKSCLLFCAVAMTLSSTAQTFLGLAPATTNKYYNSSEFMISLAPTMNFTGVGIGNTTITRTYGYSLETEYWQTAYTGTGLELGSYDYKNNSGVSLGTVDHISVMQNLRMVPWPKTKFVDRFAVGLGLGATTYFIDNSKDVNIAIKVWFATSKSTRFVLKWDDRWMTNPKLDGNTLEFAFQCKF